MKLPYSREDTRKKTFRTPQCTRWPVPRCAVQRSSNTVFLAEKSNSWQSKSNQERSLCAGESANLTMSVQFNHSCLPGQVFYPDFGQRVAPTLMRLAVGLPSRPLPLHNPLSWNVAIAGYWSIKLVHQTGPLIRPPLRRPVKTLIKSFHTARRLPPGGSLPIIDASPPWVWGQPAKDVIAPKKGIRGKGDILLYFRFGMGYPD